MQLHKKGNEWLVYDETGLKRFDSEKEALAYMGEDVPSQEEEAEEAPIEVSIKGKGFFSGES